MASFTLSELAEFEKPFKAPPATLPPPVQQALPIEPIIAAESPAAVDAVEVPEVDAAEPTPATPVDESTPPAEAPVKGSARERIEDLIAERNALKKYIEYRDSLPQAAPPAAPVAAPMATEAAPTLESCQFDTDKWTREMNSWTQKQIQSGVRAALTTEREQLGDEEAKGRFNERMAAFAAATPDVKIVLGNPALPQLAKDAAQLVVASDLGPQILYHLGRNPEKAARIARTSPIQQAAAIGRLEAELRAPVKPKALTKAPAPPTPTAGASAPPMDDMKLPLKEFMAREKQRLIERRQRH
jgi:hypothetical protein